MRPHSLIALSPLAIAALLAACGGGRGEPPDRDAASSPAAAESAAAAVHASLDDRFRAPVGLSFGSFADPRTGDSLRGQVIRISVPFDMVEEDTLPHDWLRERLRAAGWTLDAEADGPDGSSYRASRGTLRLHLQATWEDLHLPAETPDWYAVTIGIPAAGPAPEDSAR